jgi:phosphoribosylamine-glycine ligase
MGAISPVPWLPPTAVDQIMQEIVEPTYTALQEGHLLFAGILYFGIIVTEAGPRLLEYNVRFGDPEAQVVLPLIQTDFADLTEAIINRSIGQLTLSISEQSSLGVVVAAPGYPSSHPTDLSVDPLPHIESEEAFIFHASTTRGPDGIRTGGGRCFTVVGLGHELLEARANAYRTAKNVTFPGSWMRPDIGGRIFG